MAGDEKPTETNPKLERDLPTNMEKDPEQWVSGEDPMTGAQASYLQTLAEEAHLPGEFEDGLTKAEASERIDRLREKLGMEERG